MPDDPTMDDVRAAAEQVHAELAAKYEGLLQEAVDALEFFAAANSWVYLSDDEDGDPTPEYALVWPSYGDPISNARAVVTRLRDALDNKSRPTHVRSGAWRSALHAAWARIERLERELDESDAPRCIGGDCRPEWNWRRADCPVHGRKEGN